MLTIEDKARMAAQLSLAQYWTRMWIAQKVILSPAMSFFTRPDEVDIDCLSVLLDGIKELLKSGQTQKKKDSICSLGDKSV